MKNLQISSVAFSCLLFFSPSSDTALASHDSRMRISCLIMHYYIRQNEISLPISIILTNSLSIGAGKAQLANHIHSLGCLQLPFLPTHVWVSDAAWVLLHRLSNSAKFGMVGLDLLMLDKLN